METTCSRCHQTLQLGASFCPGCGLPQLVYDAESADPSLQPERWEEAVRDASSVVWRQALPSALGLGAAAGVACTFLLPLGFLGMLVMGFTAAWAVAMYLRRQQPAWITLGAGARIGLVTGLAGSWTVAATIGGFLCAARYWLHMGAAFDGFWTQMVEGQLTTQWNSMGADAQTIATMKAMMLSENGRAAWALSTIGFVMAASTVFAIAGGALSAKLRRQGR